MDDPAGGAVPTTPAGFPVAELPELTTEQMSEVDRIMVDELHITLLQMMENAERHLAELAIRRYQPVTCTVLSGPGGNGGGGLVAARHLANRGVDVEVVLSAPEAMTEVPAHQLDILRGICVGRTAGGPRGSSTTRRPTTRTAPPGPPAASRATHREVHGVRRPRVDQRRGSRHPHHCPAGTPAAVPAGTTVLGGVWFPGGAPGLRYRREARCASGGFDSRPPPPTSVTGVTTPPSLTAPGRPDSGSGSDLQLLSAVHCDHRRTGRPDRHGAVQQPAGLVAQLGLHDLRRLQAPTGHGQQLRSSLRRFREQIQPLTMALARVRQAERESGEPGRLRFAGQLIGLVHLVRPVRLIRLRGLSSAHREPLSTSPPASAVRSSPRR